MTYQLIHGDCLDILPTLEAQSVHAIIGDLPYGTTACSWDEVIPFAPMWAAVKHVLKPRGAFVTTAREPFTSAVVMSNVKNYRHKWVWDKSQSGSFQNAKFMPLQIEEDILCFSFESPVIYYPVMRSGKMRKKGGQKNANRLFDGLKHGYISLNDLYHPVNIINFPNCANKEENDHPTQKPVALYEYLIKTYTNPGDTVMDFTMGSGTTGVACIHTGRNFIGIEKDAAYFEIAKRRIEQAQPPLFVEQPTRAKDEQHEQVNLW